jgi:hypothetical protein
VLIIREICRKYDEEKINFFQKIKIVNVNMKRGEYGY